ncbi:MAG: FtsX-like permease family protein [Rhodothermales bacterium]|nr:FtsX-like permease family protein [Rhodothermales bacterium]
MYRSYLKTALRNSKRNKVYAFINILGLAVGLACTFFVVVWVQNELQIDRFHDEGPNLYRVLRTADYGPGQVSTTDAISAKLVDVLDEEYPEITHSVLMSWSRSITFSNGQVSHRQLGRNAGPEFFSLFSYPLIAGDRESALANPASVAISASMARKFFPVAFETYPTESLAAQAVVGQSLKVDNREDYIVSAVFEDVTPASSVTFQFVLPVQEYVSRNSWVDEWGNNGFKMFVRLRPEADPVVVSDKIRTVIKDHKPGELSELFLQPYTDGYLYSNFENGEQVGGRIEYVRMFVLVAFLIALIASINFMNLATARSSQRSMEIGVRKALGGSRVELSKQFLVESVLTAFVAFVTACAAVVIFAPAFSRLTGKNIFIDFGNPTLWILFGGIALAVGILSGLYPALYLSALDAVQILKGATASVGGRTFRKTLVVFQFSMSVILIVSTLTVFNQLEYIRSKDLGVSRENVLYGRLEGGMKRQFDSVRDKLKSNPAIISITRADQSPLEVEISTGGLDWPAKPDHHNTQYFIVSAGYDFLETMGISLASGRTFSSSFGADTSNILINETAAKSMGLDDPLGKSVSLWNREGVVIGVVKDFHMQSLYEPIEPLVIRLDPSAGRFVFVRTRPGAAADAIAEFETAFRTFSPEYPVKYWFMDDEFAEAYRSDASIGNLARCFAILAAFISCLGLYGLATYSAEQRTREIGIRKVLGAGVVSIVYRLTSDFLKLVGLALIIGSPLAYIYMQDWLGNFEFSTGLGFGVFIMAALATLLIALGSVGYQSIKAALANPTIALQSNH